MLQVELFQNCKRRFIRGMLCIKLCSLIWFREAKSKIKMVKNLKQFILKYFYYLINYLNVNIAMGLRLYCGSSLCILYFVYFSKGS